jgi:NAD(P)-dependent dehydrogenase (short-subunit alcohol dehydrogenase family)
MTILDCFRLDNRVAIVTGSNRGLGKAMSLALAEAGAQVAVVSRKTEQAQAVASEIQRSTGKTCYGYLCDMTVPGQIIALVDGVLNDFGQIDIVVNNAAINKQRPIEDLSLEEFREVQDTNLIGPWLLCKAMTRHLKERRYGRVISVSSAAAVSTFPGMTPYASSKAALLQMTRTLALEWGPFGITVNCILPGPFATETNNLELLKQDQKAYADFIEDIPLRRWATPDEIGGLIVFLASDASSFITGAAILIDGGQTAQ